MPKRKRKPKNADVSDVNEEDNVVLQETAPLQLRYYGDPVLRKRAKPVVEITDAELQLAEQMLMTLEAIGNGIGLAATQVGGSEETQSSSTSVKLTSRYMKRWCCLIPKF